MFINRKINLLSSEFWKTPWIDIVNLLRFPVSAILSESTVVTDVNTWVVTIFGTTLYDKEVKTEVFYDKTNDLFFGVFEIQ